MNDLVARADRLSLALGVAALVVLGALAAAAVDVSPVNRLPRFAVVVGNARYPQQPLRNPHNDASAMAQQLRRLGFDVTLKLDATKHELDTLVRDFGTKLREHNGVGLFYFAGHGAQLNWRNYLIPVDASISGAADIQSRAVDLVTLLDAFQFARTPVNIVILDACRDNPFGESVRLDQKGLSQVDAPPGTLLAYATAPGNVAADGAGANGLYTEHLLKELAGGDARVEDTFKRVRLAVRRESRGQQLPWEATSLEHDFYFSVPRISKAPTAEEAETAFEAEATAWEVVKESRDPATIENYLRRYPSGRFSELAQFRLDQVLAGLGEQRVATAPHPGNPFSRGFARVDTGYSVGDEYRFRRWDRLAGSPPAELVHRVQAVSETDVTYNKGRFITDLLGNSLVSARGTRDRGRQFFVAEYAVGKRWTTRFGGTSADGKPLAIEIDLRVVGKEPVTVAGTTFEAFQVQGRGTNQRGNHLEYIYWIAPDRVRRALVQEHVWKDKDGKTYSSERTELVSFRQMRDPAAR